MKGNRGSSRSDTGLPSATGVFPAVLICEYKQSLGRVAFVVGNDAVRFRIRSQPKVFSLGGEHLRYCLEP